jgi:outer membrane protein assembly factor BamA
VLPVTRMKFLLLVALAAPLAFADRTDDAQLSELNVNSRYTVESIDFSGHKSYRLSSSVVEDMQRLIGQNLNVSALNRLAKRITDDLRATAVTFSVARGDEPAHVRVLFDVDKRDVKFDVGIPSFSYTSREGWTGEGHARATFGANAVTFAALTNGDDLVERYSGIRTRYDRLSLGTDRIRLGFEFDAYREQYNRATTSLQAGSSVGADTYRSRLNFEPSATLVIAKPLTLTVGLGFEKLNPTSPAGNAESANAMVNTLRFHQRWEGSGAASQQDVDAGYSLRVATKALGSDYAYTRHAVHARYAFRHESQSVEVALQAGVIYGRAPLFERFVLGNSSTLRGWNKYDLAPLGGNRAVHASVTYGYHIMRVFYDTGSIWDNGKRPEEKHSVGVGITTGLGLFGKNALLLAVAFPMRQGRIEPVFIAGMNF